MARRSAGTSKGRWARNTSDRVARQEALWGGKERIRTYDTRRMKDINGKMQNYRIKTDSRGRTRILDTGLAAPADYYSQGTRYYALKANARISKDSSDKQKAFWHSNQEAILGRKGLMDQMGQQGQIRKLEGEFAEVNMRKSPKGRKMMDENQAYYEGQYSGRAGQATRAKSRYILKIGQDGREA